MYTIANFYKFIELTDLSELQERLRERCTAEGLLGTILLASEGINANLGGDEKAIDRFVSWLREDARFASLVVKKSHGDTPPFKYLLVKVKRSIVTFSPETPVSVSEIHSGPRVSPAEFRDLLQQKRDDVVILDTRNRFEVDYGTFAEAEHLDIKKFKDFVPALEKKYGDERRDKTLVMFCTGGIRCEKAVAGARKLGFEKVYQLEGGIISYLKEFGSEGFAGDCFVFDNRWAVKSDLTENAEAPRGNL